MYVVVFHTFVLMFPDAIAGGGRFIRAGGTGVYGFFVISAFCLCLSMRKDNNVGNFYLRRLFRIVPLFYALLAHQVLFGLHYNNPIPLTDLAWNASLLFNVAPSQSRSVVWAGWTIGVEMLFYAVFPILFIYARDIKRTLAITLSLILAAIGFNAMLPFLGLAETLRQEYFRFCLIRNMPIFMLGILVFHMRTRLHSSGTTSRKHGLPILGLATLLFVIAVKMMRVYNQAGAYAISLAYAGIAVGLDYFPTRVLVNRVTRYLGKISYSVYLLHPVVITYVGSWKGWINAMSDSPWNRAVIGVITVVSLVTAMASLTYRYIEQPGMDFGKALIGRLNRGAPQRR